MKMNGIEWAMWETSKKSFMGPAHSLGNGVI